MKPVFCWMNFLPSLALSSLQPTSVWVLIFAIRNLIQPATHRTLSSMLSKVSEKNKRLYASTTESRSESQKPVKPHSLALDRESERKTTTTQHNISLKYIKFPVLRRNPHHRIRPLPWRHCSLKGHLDFKTAHYRSSACLSSCWVELLSQFSTSARNTLDRKSTWISTCFSFLLWFFSLHHLTASLWELEIYFSSFKLHILVTQNFVFEMKEGNWPQLCCVCFLLQRHSIALQHSVADANSFYGIISHPSSAEEFICSLSKMLFKQPKQPRGSSTMTRAFECSVLTQQRCLPKWIVNQRLEKKEWRRGGLLNS